MNTILLCGDVAEQEQIYYRKIQGILSEKKLSSKERKRLNSELEIIRKLNSRKKLYVFYIAICWIKKDKQYYRLLGSIANTFLFWLLGIGKINPYDKSLPYELPYEIALGTL